MRILGIMPGWLLTKNVMSQRQYYPVSNYISIDPTRIALQLLLCLH